MISEQREILDEIVTKMRAGRITRRTFLERACAIGFSTGIAASLLDACSNINMPSASTVLVWEIGHQSTDVYVKVVDKFNNTNKEGIHVLYRNGPADTGQMHAELTQMLQSQKGDIDIMSMDIIWMAEFASKQWTRSLDDLWTESERKKYLAGPIQACTFRDHIWGAPYNTDVGLIYYRTDLIPQPPNTWDEMTDMAKQTKGQTTYGYIWQGAQYEGLVCNFIEVLYGYGGAVLDPKNPQKVIVNSPEAVQALKRMVDWVGIISPNTITLFKEEDTLTVWESGLSTFMREWPVAYSSGNNPETKVYEKVGVHPMLHSAKTAIGHSCIGGWQFGINSFSKKKEEAWKFIEYMIGPEAQKAIANASIVGTLAQTYDDPEVLEKNPLFKNLKSILQNAQARPISPSYPLVSQAIQKYVFKALKREISSPEALSMLQNELQTLI